MALRMEDGERDHGLMPELRIVRAGLGDVHEVVAVLEDAATWLLSRGINQWPRQFPAEYIAKTVERSAVYLVQLGQTAAATLTLQLSDIEVWGDADDDA